MTFNIEPQYHKKNLVMRYFRVAPAINEQLKLVAAETGIPAADIIGRCIEFALNHREKNGLSDKSDNQS